MESLQRPSVTTDECLVDFLDGELRTIRNGKARVVLEGLGDYPISSCRGLTVLIHLEQLWCQRVAPSMALAFIRVDPHSHENTTGSARGPRT